MPPIGDQRLREDAVPLVHLARCRLRVVRVQLDLVDRRHHVGALQQRLQVVEQEVAHADRANLAVLEQLLERLVRLDRATKGGRQRLVQNEQVDLVDTELAGALVEGVQRLVVAVVADPDLALDEHVAAVDARAADSLCHLALVTVCEVMSRSVVIATGVAWRRLGVPSLESMVGAGVFYGAAGSEAHAMLGQQVFVVGAGNSAGQAAIHLARYAASVTIVVRGTALSASMSDYLIQEISETPNIRVRLRTEVVDGDGRARLEHLTLRDRLTGATETIPAAALFVMIGGEPRTQWLAATLQRDEGGYVLTGDDVHRNANAPQGWPLGRPPALLETSIPGVFAIGDVRYRSVKRVASAAGAGAIAVQLVHEYLDEQRTADPAPG
jgi:thioredoxin reductase (NADPH)